MTCVAAVFTSSLRRRPEPMGRGRPFPHRRGSLIGVGNDVCGRRLYIVSPVQVGAQGSGPTVPTRRGSPVGIADYVCAARINPPAY